MSDCEETDLFLESWTWTPGKRKRKKDSKKDTKCLKHKTVPTMKTDEDIPKKKKKSKFKEAMEERKVKKKGKKKKKKKTSVLDLDNSVLFRQGGDAPERNKLKPDRKKKKVAFDLSPGHISAKLPKLVSLSQQPPSGSPGRSQGQNLGHSQVQSHASESQCTSEDLNSQDLFITQKTFRASPSESSSGEALPPSPPLLTSLDKLHTSMVRMKPHPQHHRETDQHVQKTKTGQDESAASRPAQTASVTKPCLDKPADVKKHSCTVGQRSPWCPSVKPAVSTGSTSTQTDNFFTSQLSTFLSFCQKRRVSVHLEDLKPLDLSLPQRARKEFGMLKSGGTRGDDLHPSGSPHGRDVEVKTDPCSADTQGKTEATLSSQSGSEPKIIDTTTSSEDEPPCRPGKLDLIQVKAVQTRLNESFFFKAKGKGQSPRPESPLMKLAQGREGKSRKSL